MARDAAVATLARAEGLGIPALASQMQERLDQDPTFAPCYGSSR